LLFRNPVIKAFAIPGLSKLAVGRGAQQARELLLRKRDDTFTELSEKLGYNVGMAEIGRTKWLAETFDRHGIEYPRTEKGAILLHGGQFRMDA
jgi:hypothetical protein